MSIYKCIIYLFICLFVLYMQKQRGKYFGMAAHWCKTVIEEVAPIQTVISTSNSFPIPPPPPTPPKIRFNDFTVKSTPNPYNVTVSASNFTASRGPGHITSGLTWVIYIILRKIIISVNKSECYLDHVMVECSFFVCTCRFLFNIGCALVLNQFLFVVAVISLQRHLLLSLCPLPHLFELCPLPFLPLSILLLLLPLLHTPLQL